MQALLTLRWTYLAKNLLTATSPMPVSGRSKGARTTLTTSLPTTNELNAVSEAAMLPTFAKKNSYWVDYSLVPWLTGASCPGTTPISFSGFVA